MHHKVQLKAITSDDASAHLVSWLRDQVATRGKDLGGLQFSLRSAIEPQFRRRQQELAVGFGGGTYVHDESVNTLPYWEAAWEMVRRGLLFPVTRFRDGEGPVFTGHEFFLTSFGEAWLAKHEGVDVLPTQFERFGQILAKPALRFRPSYHTRSQESLACYRAGLFMATCAMAGAAAESILLSLAVAKSGDQDSVLKQYRTSSGAKKLRDRLGHGANSHEAREMDNMLDLLKYWRDEASHASVEQLDEEAAFQALLLLMRLARFADEHWDGLTT